MIYFWQSTVFQEVVPDTATDIHHVNAVSSHKNMSNPEHNNDSRIQRKDVTLTCFNENRAAHGCGGSICPAPSTPSPSVYPFSDAMPRSASPQALMAQMIQLRCRRERLHVTAVCSCVQQREGHTHSRVWCVMC